jgi:hypothetical protein
MCCWVNSAWCRETFAERNVDENCRKRLAVVAARESAAEQDALPGMLRHRLLAAGAATTTDDVPEWRNAEQIQQSPRTGKWQECWWDWIYRGLHRRRGYGSLVFWSAGGYTLGSLSLFRCNRRCYGLRCWHDHRIRRHHANMSMKFIKWVGSSLLGYILLFEACVSLPCFLVLFLQNHSEWTVGWSIYSASLSVVAGAVGGLVFWTLTSPLGRQKDRR